MIKGTLSSRKLAVLLLTSLIWLVVASMAGMAAPGAGVSGYVFFDRNGDGLRGSEEPGLAGVSVTLSNGGGFSQSVNSTSDGSFAFAGVAAGSYTITEQNPAGFVSTTSDAVALTVGAGDSLGDFGDVLPHTVSGTIFDDLDLDGVQGLGEPGIEGAAIEVYDDVDGDGAVGIGEALLGADVSDEQGNYLIPDLLPGPRVLFLEIPADYHPTGSSSGEVELDLISSEVGGNLTVVNLPLRKTEPAAATLLGQVWHDRDGDGRIDADEPALSAVAITMIEDANGNGRQDAGETVAASIASDPAGAYRLFNLRPGAYIARVDASTLPSGWLLSSAMAARSLTLAAGDNDVPLGYFDLLGVSPWRSAGWRQEIAAGGSAYPATALAAVLQTAESYTQLFPWLGRIDQVLARPARSAEEKARQQYAALLLNVAAGRLFAETPIDLPKLTAAATVSAVLADIEAVLWPPFGFAPGGEYERVSSLAGELNRGEGVGLCQPVGGEGVLVDAAQICRW